MRRNALFQLGTDLGTPGTARTEDFAIAQSRAAPAANEERADHFVVRNGVRCAGAHLIIDLAGWWSDGPDRFASIQPTRITDTRQSGGSPM